MTTTVTSGTIRAVLKSHPLTRNGYRVSKDSYGARPPGAPLPDYAVVHPDGSDFDPERIQALADHLIEHYPMTKHPTSVGSYGLKHVLEKALKKHPAFPDYHVDNGEAILAAIIAGYPVKRCAVHNNPNASIGISRRAYDKQWKLYNNT